MKKNAASDAVKKVRELNESHALKDALAEYKKHGILWQLLFGKGMLDSAMQKDANTKVAADFEWAHLVADARSSAVGAGIWDHKPYISGKWTVKQLIDFTPLGKSEQVTFYYDIWSNIHYGYVGRAAGFTEEELVFWARVENLVSNAGFEPESDTVAIRIGVKLYAGTLSVPELLKKLYENKGQLHRYDPNRPQKQRVYIEK